MHHGNEILNVTLLLNIVDKFVIAPGSVDLLNDSGLKSVDQFAEDDSIS